MKADAMWVVLFLIGFLIGTAVEVKVEAPKTLDKRMKDLDNMQYDGASDAFVLKDSVMLSADDFYYLKYGKVNNGCK